MLTETLGELTSFGHSLLSGSPVDRVISPLEVKLCLDGKLVHIAKKVTADPYFFKNNLKVERHFSHCLKSC